MFSTNKQFYIFLDIDGVMNNEDYVRYCWNNNGEKPMHMNYTPMDPRCLQNLKWLCDYISSKQYNVNIVLSSTWRLSEVDYEIVVHRLAEYGLRLVGVTKKIDMNRGVEIKDYLKEICYTPNYDSFIILDDDSYDIDYIEELKSKHILTDAKYGFNSFKLDEAKDLVK